ncbi:hypothetical protein GOODEAATRI_008450, partial [Goodea atripinnis]
LLWSFQSPGWKPKVTSPLPLWPLNFKPLQTVEIYAVGTGGVYIISKLCCNVQMLPYFTSVLLVTSMSSAWAQDFNEERKTYKKSRARLGASSIHDGQAILDEDCSLELSFLLDSSETAKDNHEQEKRFAMDMVDRLQGAQLPTGRSLSSRVALLQYSSHVIKEQTLRDWRGSENFKNRITPIVYIGHGTYTTYAITNMTKIYQEESRPGSIKVVVLLTDGVSHPRNPDIFSAVADAKNLGIKFFTLGITRTANEPANRAELRLLASSPGSRFLHNLQDEDIVEKIFTEVNVHMDRHVQVFDNAQEKQMKECGYQIRINADLSRVQKVQLEQKDQGVYRGYQEHRETLDQRGLRESRENEAHRALQEFREKLVSDFLVQKVNVVFQVRRACRGSQDGPYQVQRVKLVLLDLLVLLGKQVLVYLVQKVLKAYQAYQVSPDQREWEFQVQRFVPVKLYDLNNSCPYLCFHCPYGNAHLCFRVTLALEAYQVYPDHQERAYWDHQ